MDHASPLDLGFLSLISSGIAATGPLWEPLVRFTDGAVADELLLTSERYEVWLRCWAPGAQTELDPAGNVAYTVVRGSLVGHDVGGDQAELVHVGETRSVPTGVRYGLADLDDEPAVSIHAVSPAVPADHRTDRVALSVIAGTAPRLPESIVGYAAHPSRRRLAG